MTPFLLNSVCLEYLVVPALWFLQFCVQIESMIFRNLFVVPKLLHIPSESLELFDIPPVELCKRKDYHMQIANEKLEDKP